MYYPKSMLLVERVQRRPRNHLQKRRKRRLRSVQTLLAHKKREELTFILQEFYTEGIVDLLEARRSMAEYSLPRLDFRYTALLA